MKKIKAPFDGKNVTTDWIEDVFDNQTCLFGNKKNAIGFINGEAVLVAWSDNILLWKFTEQPCIDSGNLAVLKDRLSRFADTDSNLVDESKVIANIYYQQFYFTED